MRKIVLCTNNAGKREELRALIPSDIELLPLAGAGILAELRETGSTLRDNALQKAREAYAQCGLPCLADDSGLEVDALKGAPGVHSAHYAGPQRDQLANTALLLSRMQGQVNRSARFRTVLALVDGPSERLFEGSVEGTIAFVPTGTEGFGYDPIFIPRGEQRTFAEMNLNEKNGLSHRQRAVSGLLQYLSR